MTDNEKKFTGYWSVFCMNFCSSFNPVYFCTIVALLLYRDIRLFEQQALNVLLISAFYTVPWLCSSAASHAFLVRFSSRNVIFYSRVVEVLISIAATCLIAYTDKTGYIPLFVIAVLMGLTLSIYRPALKVYTSKTVSRQRLAKICAATECATLLGITAGTVAGVVAVHWHTSNVLAVAFTIAVAAVALVCSSLLKSIPAPKSEKSEMKLQLQIQIPKGFVKMQRYRELVMTGVGECYVFAALILISSIAIQYLGQQSKGVTPNIYLQYFMMGTPIIGAALGVLSSGYRSRDKIEIGFVPTGILLMTFSALAIGGLPYAGNFYTEGSILAVLLFIFGFASGSILVPLQCYQAYFVKRECSALFQLVLPALFRRSAAGDHSGISDVLFQCEHIHGIAGCRAADARTLGGELYSDAAVPAPDAQPHHAGYALPAQHFQRRKTAGKRSGTSGRQPGIFCGYTLYIRLYQPSHTFYDARTLLPGSGAAYALQIHRLS